MSKISKDIQETLDNPFAKIGLCPKCGRGYLIKRSGRNGFFFGCSNFPKCYYSQKMNKKQLEATKEIINQGGLI